MSSDHAARREPIPFPDDDPRHGTYAGAVAHYKAGEKPCGPCSQAQYIYGTRRKYDAAKGNPRLLPITGYRRRLQALQAIGYSLAEIRMMLGVTKGTLSNRFYQSQWVSRTNFDILAEVYEQVCMKPNPNPDLRTIRNARRKGYAPPLSWDDDDDIDDPQARPHGGSRDGRSDVDPVVVERLLAGDRVPSNRAEKEEALRRWVAMGRSQKSLCELHGWHQGRYGRAA